MPAKAMFKDSEVEESKVHMVKTTDNLLHTQESPLSRRTERSSKLWMVLWDRYCDSWWPEVAATGLSVVCTIAIAAILATLNGKPAPALSYGLTLNAIVSVLATTSKAAMIFAVSSALGQLKWSQALATKLGGSVNVTYDKYFNVTDGRVITAQEPFVLSGPRLFSSDEIKNSMTTGADKIINNLASSLSRLGQDLSVNPGNATNIRTGSIGTLVTHVEVRWIWLMLPIALCIGSTSFLTVTIIINSRTKAPLWKSSINVLFYHGLDHDMGLHTSLRSIPEMETQSSTMRARLTPYGRNDRLVMETSLERRGSW